MWLPAPGRWVRLEVDAPTVGISGGMGIDGMAFTLFDGRAAYGPAGVWSGRRWR